jgi:hypothetical protein
MYTVYEFIALSPITPVSQENQNVSKNQNVSIRKKFEQSCQKPIVFGSSSRFGGCSTEFSHADTSFCGTNKSLWIATWPLLEVHGTRGEVARRSCCVPLRGDARPLRTAEHPHNRHTTSTARRQVHPCTRAVESGSAGPSVELSV